MERSTRDRILEEALDLFGSRGVDAVSLDEIEGRLADALAEGRFDAEQLGAMARKFGTRRTRSLIERVTAEVAA